MFRGKQKILLLALIALISGCGGGGGGSSSSDSAGQGQNARQGVRLIHSAIDFGPLEIYSALGSVDSARFGDLSYHGSLATGLQNINLTPQGAPGSSLWSASINQQSEARKTVLVYGGYKDQDLKTSVIEDSPQILEKSFAYVRFINGLADSSNVQFSIANVVQSAATKSGSASLYVPVAPGSYDFLVTSGSVNIGRVSGTIEAAKAYSVVAYGVEGYLVSTNLLED